MKKINKNESKETAKSKQLTEVEPIVPTYFASQARKRECLICNSLSKCVKRAFQEAKLL